MKKQILPLSLNICLVGHRFQILSRSSDSGHLWPIARGLAKAGHKVTVISTKSPLGKHELVRDGVRAFYLYDGDKSYTHQRFTVAAYKKFLELHKEEPFHLVHSLDNSAYKIAQAKKENRVAVTYDVEATQMAQLFSILGMAQDTVGSILTTAAAVTYKFLTTYFSADRGLLAGADGIFVTNPQQRVILERYYLYPDFHIYTVPYGMDVGSLTPKESSLQLKARLGLPEHAQVVLSFTDMNDVGEVIPLLRAFERLAVKKTNAYLILLGMGPQFKKIEFETLQLALGSRVLMPGAVKAEEVMDYVLLGDVYINLSSRSTGFEPTMIEAMAQKKVIIGSEVSPISHIVEEGVDGFLVRPADSDDLAQLMLKIFSDEVPTQEIGEKAREKVVNLFDTQKMTQSVIDAYRKVLLNSGYYK